MTLGLDAVPLAVWLALFSVIAVPVAAWSLKTVREANRVVTAAASHVTTIAAQDECIRALELKLKTLQATMDTQEHEHALDMARALKRIDELETIVRQWRIVRDVPDRRAARHEVREIRDEARDDAAVERQHARADRHEAREIAQEARDAKVDK